MPAQLPPGIVGHSGFADPGMQFIAITPDDANDLVTVTRGIYVGVSGNLKIMGYRDTVAVTLIGLAAGILHPIMASRIYATGTTATSIIAAA